MRVLRALAATIGAAWLLTATAGAAVSLDPIGSFDQPVALTAPPGDTARVFVVEKPGRIQVVGNGAASTFLDLTDRVLSDGGEQGLLSIAFAPDYATSGLFYAYYTRKPDGDLIVAELHRGADAGHGTAAGARTVLHIAHSTYANHNGGQLQFGPDGRLWVGTGDGGDANDSLGNAPHTDAGWTGSAAGRDARLGKLLRIDPTAGGGCATGGGACTIPADNPGFGQPEVWAYGLRNPWRFSFDRLTGDLVVGDVGQNTWEEIDFLASADRGRGGNFGWHAYEGLHPSNTTTTLAPLPAGYVWPVIEKQHAGTHPFASIVGGYVVRDAALPDLEGRYLYGDTYSGEVWSAALGAGGATGDALTTLDVPMLSSFGEDACGRIYALSLNGPVYRLAESGACAPATSPPPGTGTGTGTGGGGGGGTATPGAGGGTPAAPGAGASGPALTLAAAARQRPWRTGVVRVRARCEAACTVTARATFAILRGRAGGSATTRALRTATVRAALPTATTRSLVLRVSARTRRSLIRALRRHRRVLATFAATAVDGNGRAANQRARAQVAR